MTTRRRLVCAVTILLAAALADAQSVRLKIAALVPDGTFWIEEARRGGEQISEQTDGRVSLRIYPGGTMGSDDAVLRKIRIGQLQGGVVLAGSLSKLNPDMEILNLPLMFRSYDEVDYVRNRLDQKLIESIADERLIAFGLVETGFVYLMSSKPTRTFADLKGRKAWIPEGDMIGKAIASAVGLSPVPLGISDVLTGLQTGLIDTVAAPPVGAVALQWFTKARYVTDMPITYVYGTLVVSDKAFRKMSPEDREVVRKVLTAVSKKLDRRTRIDNEKAREALAKQGVTFIVPTPATEQRWSEVAEDARNKLISEQGYDLQLIGEMERLLADFRAR